MFIENILKSNIQSMIFLYKRVILNDIDHFLSWFKQEIIQNQRFRDVYLLVCGNSMRYVEFQWQIMSDTDPTTKKVGYEFVSNKIEMKFEQTLLQLESQEPPNLLKINIFHKYLKCMKILDDAPYHPGLTDHILTLSQ